MNPNRLSETGKQLQRTKEKWFAISIVAASFFFFGSNMTQFVRELIYPEIKNVKIELTNVKAGASEGWPHLFGDLSVTNNNPEAVKSVVVECSTHFTSLQRIEDQTVTVEFNGVLPGKKETKSATDIGRCPIPSLPFNYNTAFRVVRIELK